MALKVGAALFCLLAIQLSFYAFAVLGSSLSRSDFPEEFIFGAGSAAYQSEGAADIDGRGPSIWDTFTKKYPEKISDYSNGDVADDFYHRYKDDVKLMKDMGLGYFRFSISWSRILPRGKLSGGVNQKGIQFYNNLINELLANGIKPFVTIFHWDLPQALQDEYGGFLSSKIVEDFKDFADLCFKEFGDRVKDWTTLNEPNLSTWNGYAYGTFAPGRCSNNTGKCLTGNSAVEPYLAGHHLLLCHATTVKLYRQNYEPVQKGTIGIALSATWILPIDGKPSNQIAASRSIDFSIGWFVDPIVFGDYPKTMRTMVGNRLPKFTDEETQMLKQSFDFIGLNYYTTYYASNSPYSNDLSGPSYATDNHATLTAKSANGDFIGQPTQVSWLYIYPKGIRDLVLFFKEKYNNPTIIITENGMGDLSSAPIKESLNDHWRIKYIRDHLFYLQKSIKEGANVKGYFVWSFLDDYEWNSGFTTRFGLYLVDFNNNLKRQEKLSATWFKNFLARSTAIPNELKNNRDSRLSSSNDVTKSNLKLNSDVEETQSNVPRMKMSRFLW